MELFGRNTAFSGGDGLMRRLRWMLPCLVVLAAGLLYAGADRVTERTLWIVPYDQEGVLRVRPGDVIEVWTQPLPVIPENLEARFRASKTGQGVELVGETLPHKEGTMERLYFFKAFDPGPATLKIELINMDGSVRSTRTYQVEVAEATSDP
jgi:hypothetical protein